MPADPPHPGAGPRARPARRRSMLWLLTVCLVVVALLAGWLRFFAPARPPQGLTMTDLGGISDLRARFNADRGLPRLVVIFSPT